MNAFAKKLMAGAAMAALVLSMGSTVRAQGKDIVDTAVGAGQFKTLAGEEPLDVQAWLRRRSHQSGQRVGGAAAGRGCGGGSGFGRSVPVAG